MEILEKYTENIFEIKKHIDEYGVEFWSARELQVLLECAQWKRFNNVIEKSKIACQNNGYNTLDHFTSIDKTIKMSKGTIKKINDYKLSRYACYLIAQNSDNKKQAIALAQTYFAM